jgi:hypothetical protein
MWCQGFESLVKSRCSRLGVGALLLAFVMVLGSSWAWAGPPFLTDDPETVEPQHGEFYVAGQYLRSKDGKSGTAPHLEFNYGLVEDVQLHMIVPLAWNTPNNESTKYGLGDLELGVKYRFIHEGDWMPQVAMFPIVTLPTGDKDNGLGEGRTRVFLPLWFQKSWEPWTTYAGGGYWINPGAGNQNYWFTGWVVQRKLCSFLTLGAEIYYATADTVDGTDRYGYTAGAIVDLTEEHHVLLSGGHDLHGDNDLTLYLAYQYTFSLAGEKKK